MKAQSKSRLFTIPWGGSRSRPAPTGEEADASGPSGLQSLAAELHQSALQGEFSYPRNWSAVTRGLACVLVAAGFAHLEAALMPALRSPGLTLAELANWRVAGALLGAVLAVMLAALLANMLQTIQITPQGLGIAELFTWRVIPWDQIGVLRVMELPSSGTSGGRYVVMVPFKEGARTGGSPAPMLRLLPLLLGAAPHGERGVLITSDIKNFERLLQLIVAYMGRAAGQTTPAIEAYIDEAVEMPVAQLLLDPGAALARLTRTAESTVLDPYGMPSTEDEHSVPWVKVISRQMLLALPPALMLLADVMVRSGQKPFLGVHVMWVSVLMLLGVAELPFVAKLIQSVGDLMVGSGRFKRTLWAYLELQVPRALLVLLGAALVGVGVPPIAGQVLWLAGIIVTTVLATRFVQRLYYLNTMQALLGTAGACMYQMMLFALYYGAR